MRNIFKTIALENFRSSGYFTHPCSERRTEWQFTDPPRSPFQSTDTVRTALLRRKRAQFVRPPTPFSLLQHCVHALFRR